MTNIEDLRTRLKWLDDLLADPHPESLSWEILYKTAVVNLLEFWQDDELVFQDPICDAPATPKKARVQ